MDLLWLSHLSWGQVDLAAADRVVEEGLDLLGAIAAGITIAATFQRMQPHSRAMRAAAVTTGPGWIAIKMEMPVKVYLEENK